MNRSSHVMPLPWQLRQEALPVTTRGLVVLKAATNLGLLAGYASHIAMRRPTSVRLESIRSQRGHRAR